MLEAHLTQFRYLPVMGRTLPMSTQVLSMLGEPAMR